MTQFLLQYQYHVYRKLAPLVKDVGFPDARSGRKASSSQVDLVYNESLSDEAVNKKSDADGEDEEKQEQDTNLQRFPSDSDSKKSGNKANEDQEDNAEEKGHHNVEQHEVVFGDNSHVDEGSTVDNECVSTVTDLEKLKNLLHEEAKPETPKDETTQIDGSSSGPEPLPVAVSNESENLENYFQELEDDMFGWESDEGDKNASYIETGDSEDCREMNKKSLSEGKEESDPTVEENRTEVVEELTDASDVALPSQVDSPQSDDTHPSDDTHEASETDPSCKIGVKSQQINGKEEMVHPRNDGNTLETNESDSSPEEQFTDEQRTRDNTTVDNEEEVQESKDLETIETPAEQKSDQANFGDQENIKIPNLPLYAGEDDDDRKGQDDSITVPPTDEVRKQLKDVLVDVRFFLGMYI